MTATRTDLAGPPQNTRSTAAEDVAACLRRMRYKERRRRVPNNRKWDANGITSCDVVEWTERVQGVAEKDDHLVDLRCQRLEAVKALRTLACERVNCTHSIDRRSSRPMLYPRAVAWCLSRSMLYAVMDLVARQTEVRITFVVDGVGNGE